MVAPHIYSQSHPVILIAGGIGAKTTQLFTAEALAGELRARHYTLALFIDRLGNNGKDLAGDLRGLDTHPIRVGRVVSGGLIGRIRAFADVAFAAFQARRLLRELNPSVVVSFGSYASVPAMMAAAKLQIPTIIHEQEAVFGRANRLLAPAVSAIATSFPVITDLQPVDRGKVTFTGNPVGKTYREVRQIPYSPIIANDPIHLLVLGGSETTAIFDQVVPQALSNLPQGLRSRLRVSQQCQPKAINKVRDLYVQSGIRVDASPAFDDLSSRFGLAHLVICRADAITLAGLATVGRPAILVPDPHARDDLETINAKAVDSGGGSVIMPEPGFTQEPLTARIKLLLDYGRGLANMAERIRAVGHDDAAANLADLVARLIPANGDEAPNPGGDGSSEMRERAA